MMKKRMLGVLALMLVCIFALSGCKKNVGTPEDNAVKEDSQDGEDAEEEEYTYSFGYKLFFHSDWRTAASDISCNFVNVFYMNHLDGFCTYGFGRLF